MAASFPNAKKTFSQVVNGVTKLVALLFNVAYDEAEAIETFIGAQGCTSQAYTSSLKDLLSDYQKGCQCDYKGIADLYVRSGALAIADASGNIRIRRNPSDTTVQWAASGLCDGLDTGSEAANTQYYIYAVADTATTTFTVKISTSASAPTGATFYRKLGSFYNDGSSNIVLVKETATEALYEANGTTDINTTSTTFVDMTDMSRVVSVEIGDSIELDFSACVFGAGTYSDYQLLRDSTVLQQATINSGTNGACVDLKYIDVPGAGTYTYKIQWLTQGGQQLNCNASSAKHHRNLRIRKLKTV